MKLLSFAFMVAICAVGCGDDSPAGGADQGGSSAGGEAAGGAPSAGAPGDGGSGGVAEGGAAPQGLCTATAAAGECPTLLSCDVNMDDQVVDVLCGCAAEQEGEFCQVDFSSMTEGCAFGANCVNGQWLEEVIPD